jgi:hypothetical protein
MKAEKLIKKARKAGLAEGAGAARPLTRRKVGLELFELAGEAQRRGWSAEALLRAEIRGREGAWRRQERQSSK